MRFLIRLDSSDPSKENFLGSVRRLAATVGAEVHNPKWTSKRALELDYFVPSAADSELFLSVLRPIYSIEFVRDLNTPPPHMSEKGLISEARQYFDSERYWECHEVLESVWRRKTGDEKLLLQGMILVCAAFVHHQKGEHEVAVGVLKRALVALRVSSTKYRGIDLQLLRGNADRVIRTGTFEPFAL